MSWRPPSALRGRGGTRAEAARRCAVAGPGGAAIWLPPSGRPLLGRKPSVLTDSGPPVGLNFAVRAASLASSVSGAALVPSPGVSACGVHGRTAGASSATFQWRIFSRHSSLQWLEDVPRVPIPASGSQPDHRMLGANPAGGRTAVVRQCWRHQIYRATMQQCNAAARVVTALPW